MPSIYNRSINRPVSELGGRPVRHDRDWIAGLSVAGLMLPEAVAYAGIAGLPPQRAIIAAIVGCLTYCALGRSRFAIVAPTSSSAAILAATLAATPGSIEDKMALVTVITAFMGILFLAASVLRLGNLAGFVSRPVLRGFAFGLAVTIIFRQLPVLAGIPVSGADISDQAISLFSALPHWHLASMLVGCAALAALLLLRYAPFLPGVLLVLIAGIFASRLLNLQDDNVMLVGAIPIMPAWPAISMVQWLEVFALLPYTLPMVLILFAESWGTIRSLSLRHAESVTANRELCALGAANLASALAQGMPVGAGFSAGAASEAAGAESRMTGIVAAVGVIVITVFGVAFVADLPQPVLAAVVIAALTHALDPRPLLRLWALKHDVYVALAAAIGVIAFGVLNGVLLAVVLSLVALLRKLATPYVARLGRLNEGHDFVDMARHADAKPVAGIAIWRPSQSLFFANADAMLNAIAARIGEEPAISAVVVSLEESFDLDSTALDALLEFDTVVRASGKSLHYARVHDRVRDFIALAAPTLVDYLNFSVDDAVAAASQPLPQPRES
ncbi:SulP family inorganic anion transporter [Rhizobium ruizarguesonis]